MENNLSLPIADWPMLDRKAWADAFADDYLDAPRTATWRSSTKKHATFVYGLWLKWLQEHGRLTEQSPGERLSGQNIKDFAKVQLSRGLSLATVAGRVRILIALTRGMSPGAKLDDACKLRNRLLRAVGKTRQPKGHIVHAGRIYQLGLDLIDQGRALGPTTAEGARLQVDGLAIALLIACPVRLETFCSLRFDRELIKDGDRWRMWVASGATKTGQPEVRVVPADLTAPLDEYVSTIRPMLMAKRKSDGADAEAFFIGTRGQRLQGQMMRKRIVARTTAAFGKPILPHSFRKAAITTLVMEHPQHAPSAPLLLTHTGTKTAEDHYIIRQQLLALDRYQKTLTKMEKRQPEDGTA